MTHERGIGGIMATGTPCWAVAYHCNSSSPRARKWYRVARLVYVDGAWFELYWHPNPYLRSDSRAEVRSRAAAAGVDLVPGTYRDAAPPRNGSVMVKTA